MGLSPVEERGMKGFGAGESQTAVLFQERLGQTYGKSSSQSCPSEGSHISQGRA